MFKKLIIPLLLVAGIFSACKKETAEPNYPTIADYAPLEAGKYIIYQLDSFRYLPFSTVGITASYQVKFFVDAAITDNSGRPSFRIIRYIRENNSDPWTPDNTFMATNTGTSYEFVDNNMRFIKLSLPINSTHTWMGNSYINTTTQFTDYRYLEGWEYAYDSLNAPLTLNGINIDSTIKVAQRDEIIGNPDDRFSYSELNYGTEYYAKGIGLVYKKMLHSEYQPPTTVGGSGYYSDATKGYTLTLLEHN